MADDYRDDLITRVGRGRALAEKEADPTPSPRQTTEYRGFVSASNFNALSVASLTLMTFRVRATIFCAGGGGRRLAGTRVANEWETGQMTLQCSATHQHCHKGFVARFVFLALPLACTVDRVDVAPEMEQWAEWAVRPVFHFRCDIPTVGRCCNYPTAQRNYFLQ